MKQQTLAMATGFEQFAKKTRAVGLQLENVPHLGTGEESSMYAILFRALAPSADRQKLIDFLKLDGEVSKGKEPGMLRFDVLEDPESDAIYVYEAYQNRAAFDKHREGDLYQEWDSRIKPNLQAFRILYEG